MANVMFKSGSLAQFNNMQTKDAGTLYFVTDEKAIYLGQANNQTVRFGGDIEKVANVAALATLTPNSNKLYYAIAENVMAYYNGTKWVQINAAGLTQIEIEGEGNVLAGARVADDATTGAKKLTFTLAEVATTQGMAALESAVGALENRADVLEDRMDEAEEGLEAVPGLIESAVSAAKTELNTSISANSNAIDALENRVDAAESGISALEASIDQTNTNLINLTTRVTTAEGKITTAEGKITVLEGKHEAGKTVKQEIEAITTPLGSRLNSAESDITALEGNVTTLMADNTTPGSVKYEVKTAIDAVVDSAPEAFDTLKEIATWIQDDKTGAAAMAKKIEELDTSMTNAQDDISDLESENASQGTDIANILTALGMATGSARSNTVTNEITAKGNELTGTSSDTSSAITIYGARALANEAKTAAATNAASIASLETRMGTAESDIGSLENSVAAIPGAIASAVDGVVGTASDYKTLGAAETAIKANAANIATNATDIATNAIDIDNLENRMNSVESTISASLVWGSF